MKRRKFIYNVGLGALVAAAGSAVSRTATATPKNKFRWRLALVVPKTLPIWGPGVERFADNVKIITGGALDIRVYGAGELVSALGTFEAVQKGQIDMHHSSAYYWQGKVPATPFFCTVPFGMDANGLTAWLSQGGGQQLWDELMSPFGVKCLPLGNTGYQMTGWFNREIKSVEDLKGLKMRVPGLGGKIYAKAGVTPVLLPGGEIFTSMSTGVLDAVEWVGPYHDTVLGLDKTAKFYYAGNWNEPGPTLELMINKKSWGELPKEIQKAVETCAAEAGQWMQASWEAKNAEFLAKIKANKKIQITEFPESVLDEFKQHASDLKEEIAKTSPLARKIYDSYSKFQKEFETYQALSEGSNYNKYRFG